MDRIAAWVLVACALTVSDSAQAEREPFRFAWSVDSNTDGLNRINLQTGEVQLIGALHEDPNRFMTPVRMAIRPSDGTLFASNNSPAIDRGISRLDPETGRATLVLGSTHLMQGIAFDDRDQLYVVYQDSDRFRTIDLETGEISDPFGDFVGLISSLAWNQADEHFYATGAPTNFPDGFVPLLKINREGFVVSQVLIPTGVANQQVHLAVSEDGVFFGADRAIFRIDPLTGLATTPRLTLTFPYLPQGLAVVSTFPRQIPALSSWVMAALALTFLVAGTRHTMRRSVSNRVA